MVTQDQVQVRSKWEGLKRRRCRRTRLGTPHSLRSQLQTGGDSSIFSLEATILPALYFLLPPDSVTSPSGSLVPSFLTLLVLLTPPSSSLRGLSDQLTTCSSSPISKSLNESTSSPSYHPMVFTAKHTQGTLSPGAPHCLLAPSSSTVPPLHCQCHQ